MNSARPANVKTVQPATLDLRDYVHSRLTTAAGVLKLAMLLGNDEMVRWAKKVCDWTLQTQSSNFGWVAEHVDFYDAA
jgi:hypothetical protein